MKKEMTAEQLTGYYKNTFATEDGRAVLADIKLLLTGCGINEYEGVDPLSGHGELIAKTATRNAWDMISAMADGVEPRLLTKDEVKKLTKGK